MPTPTITVRNTVKHRIRAIRDGLVETEDGHKMSARERIHQVAKVVAYDLQQFGCFYYEERGRPFYFEYDTKNLIDLSCANVDSLIFMRRYGINGADLIHKYVMREIIEDIYIYGTPTVVHRLGYYNDQTGVLYVYNEASIERITADEIRTVPNGTDGVLFLKTQGATPWVRGEQTDPETSLSDQYLWDPVTLADDELTATERRKFLIAWFYAMFFTSILPTRPILTLVGPKGSGKTFILQIVGKLLFGDSFNVGSVPADGVEFDTIASNSTLFAIDNADTKCKWLEDRLAVASTGGIKRTRVLYTTNRMAEIAFECWVAITSRSPQFRRDDVAERLLLMQLDQHKDKGMGSYETLKKVKQYRNEIMTEICFELQQTVKAQQLILDQPIDDRMSDFALFVFRMGKLGGLEDWYRRAFKKLFLEQSRMAIEADPVIDLLRESWIPDHQGQEAGTKVIFESIKAKYESTQKDAFFYKNAISFGMKLSNIQSNLEEWYIITKRKGKGGVTFWTFTDRVKVEKEGSPKASPSPEPEAVDGFL